MAHVTTVAVDKTVYDKKRAPPDLIDVHVGNCLRFRRMLLGLTLTSLGESVGTSFQQIQKYENGSNRISASRLFELSQALGVPVGYFFEGISSSVRLANSGMAERDSAAFMYEFLGTRDALELNQAFIRIKDINVRKSVIHLVRSLGC